ncbi:hypothetical protein HZC31_02885 [Candidatus Woesearchaeota archaeon]|nr:hypothetical protein [Candidatus Woesearchaeota archaeon]
MASLERLVVVGILAGCHDYNLTNRPPREENDINGGAHEDDSGDSSGMLCSYAQTAFVPPTENTSYDIFMVVDTSCSMDAGEESRVYEWYEHILLPSLPAYADWQLKVISADPTLAVADTSAPFNRITVNRDWSISLTTVEEPFAAILSYMNGGSASWMRDDAPLEFLIFTDEDDQSFFDGETTEMDDDAVSHFTTQLYSLKNPDLVYFSSTVVPESSSCTGTVGYRLINITNQHQGYLNTICEDFQTWDAQALHLEDPDGAYQPVLLQYYPVEETLTLYVNGVLTNRSSWTYDADENIVDYTDGDDLPGNSILTVTYDIKIKEYGYECPLE